MVLGLRGTLGLVLEGLRGLEIHAGVILVLDVLGLLVGGFHGDHFARHRGVAKVARLGIVLADAMLRVGLHLYLHLQIRGKIIWLLGITAAFLGWVF
jgi:hypothetical protein